MKVCSIFGLFLCLWVPAITNASDYPTVENPPEIANVTTKTTDAISFIQAAAHSVGYEVMVHPKMTRRVEISIDKERSFTLFSLASYIHASTGISVLVYPESKTVVILPSVSSYWEKS